MTPGARVAGAIEVLEDMQSGLPAEQALTRWARKRRFAGSKDRAAIRDHVFDVLRLRALAAHYGRGTTPRALMIGMLFATNAPLDTLFDGSGYGPAVLTDEERDFPEKPDDKQTILNLPEWVIPLFEDALGDRAEANALALQSRAPVFLRVNTAFTTRDAARAALRAQGIETDVHPTVDSALTVVEGARKVRQSQSYLNGEVELQDASSQAVALLLPTGGRLLDYCAGGGGKSLALAADRQREVFAHDIDPQRMADLPSRAERAGARIATLKTEELAQTAPFDVVLCDAPCSGSGAWRRAAEGKWMLTPERLNELTALQDQILAQAANFVGKDGILAYATCSVLRTENEDRIAAFLNAHSGWALDQSKRFEIDTQGDGFFVALLRRQKS